MGLLKLAEKYSPAKLESVCVKALTFSPRSAIRASRTLWSMEDDPEEVVSDRNPTESTRPRGITKGARYHRGKKS